MKHSAALIAFFMLMVFISCNFVGGQRISGNGNVTTVERALNQFTHVEQKGSFDVYVSTGNSYTVKIEAEDNLQPYIETNVSNGRLEIKTKDGFWIRPKKQLKVYITAPTYNSIQSFGSGNIVSENTLYDSSKITLKVSGSADIKATVNAPEVESQISGSGNVNLNGETRSFSGRVSGSGDIIAFDLKAEDVEVNIAGSGNAKVFASVKLDATVNGSGDVIYKGNAPSVKSSIHGSGSIKKTEN